MKWFKSYELVPESLHKLRGERSLQLIDKRLMEFLDKLREALGSPITVNTWKQGGQFSQRGLRTREFYKSDKAYQESLSQHKFGRACDFDVKGMTASEVRQWIIGNRNLWWVKGIGFLEDDVNWVHVDFRFINDEDDLWVWSVVTGRTEVYKRSN